MRDRIGLSSDVKLLDFKQATAVALQIADDPVRPLCACTLLPTTC